MPKHTKSQNSDPGVALLNKIFGDIASSPLAVRRCQRATNKQINQPEERVKHHLERLEEAIKRPRRDMDGEVRQERLQRALVNKATINLQDEALVEKIARGIFASEKKAAQERGDGQGMRGLHSVLICILIKTNRDTALLIQTGRAAKNLPSSGG